MAIKSWLQSINAVGAAVKALGNTNGTIGANFEAIKNGILSLNPASINVLQQAIKGLTAEQAVLALATKGATAEQIEEILTTETATLAKGAYTQADIQAALAKYGLATATTMITAAQQEEILNSGILTSENMAQIASILGLQTAEDGSLVAKEALTAAMVKEALTEAGVVGAQQAEILSILGLTGAEVGATTATNLLTGALTKLKAAIISHPIGAMIVGAAAIIAAVVAIKNHIDETKQKAEEAIKETHDNAQNAFNDAKNALSQTKSDLSDVESKLEDVNAQIAKIASKTSISLVDRNEIEKLSNTKQLLLEQQSLLKQTAEMQSQNVAAQANSLLKTKTDKYKTYAPEGDSAFGGSYSYDEWYEYFMDSMENIYSHQIDYMQKNNTAKLQSLQQNMALQKGEAYSYISELNSILSGMQNADGSIVEGYEAIYKEYSGYLHNLQAYLDPDNFWDMVKGFNITDIDIGGMYEEALKSVYAGNFDINKVNKQFIDALADKGIDKDTINYVFQLKQEQYKDVLDVIEKKYPSPKKEDFKPKLTPDQYSKAIDAAFNPNQVVYDISGNEDKDTTKKIQDKAKAIGDRLKQYMQNNPVEFGNFVNFDGAYSKLDQYAQEAYEKTKDWDKAFSTAMSKVQLDVKTEGQADEKAKVIRERLLDYAEKNPVEFELIATYDTNFNLLDKYIDEELKHTKDMGKAVNNALDRVKEEMSEFNTGDGISFVVDIKTETENINKLNTAIKESASATGLTSESIENLTQKYQGLSDFDADKLFERTATGIRLNKTELQGLESQYSQIQKQKNDKWLQTLLTRYKDLEKQIANETDAQERANLLAQRNTLYNKIQEAGELASMYDGLTSAFNRWQNAQSGAEAGDTYDTIRNGLKDIQELYDEGLVGQDKFRTYVDMLTFKDLSTASVDEVVSAWNNLGKNIKGTSYSIKDFLKEDEQGVSNFLNAVQDVNKEWAKQNEDGSWEINFGEGNDEEIAKRLGTTTEFIQSMLQKLKDYGFDIKVDSAYTSLEKLESQADKANQKLIKLGKTNVTFDFGGVDLQTVNGEIDKAKQMLEQFKKSDGTVDLSIEGAKEAQSILATLIYQKQQLDDSSILKVDTSQVKGKIGSAIKTLQTFKEKYNTLEVETSIGADSSKSEKEIDKTIKKIDKIPKSIKTKLGLDDEGFQNAVKNVKANIKAGVKPKQEDLDTINSQISKIKPKMLVEAGVDSKLVDGYEPEDKTATITYKSPSGQTIEQYQTTIDSWKPSDKSAKITYTRTVKGSSKLLGTAFAGGNWGTKDDGVALGGEVKPEILVRDGKWHLIGQNSAEMFHYKKGDIIFNGDQTEQILKYGRITKGKHRGTSYAQGNAFSEGSGKFRVGGSGNGSKNDNNNKNDSKTKTKTKDKDKEKTKPLDNFKKWAEKFVDWIEVRLTRIQTKIDNATKKAENFVDAGKFGKAATQYRKAINETYKAITANTKGSNKYQKHANKILNEAVSKGVIKKKTADSIKKKVANGTIDIKKYGEGTREIISQYKEFYEKSKDCSNALIDLNKNLSEYYEKLYNLPIDKAASKIEKLSNALDVLSAKTEAVKGGANVYSKVRKVNAKSDRDAAKKAYDNSVKDTDKKADKLLGSLKGKAKKNAKKKIKKGKKVSTKGLKGKALKQAKAYNKAIDAQRIAKKEYSDAKSAYSSIKDYTPKKVSGYTLPDYSYENNLLDQQTANSKSQFKAQQAAARTASKNRTAAEKAESKAASKLLKDKGLTKAQKKAIESGKKVSTKGLKGKALKDAKAYNKAIKALSAAKKADKTATQNAQKAEADYAKTLQENTKAKLDNIQASYDSVRSLIASKVANQQAQISFKQSNGERLDRSAYNEIINQAAKDEETAKAEYDAYKKAYEENKDNLSEEDKNTALQQIQVLEQAWYDAQTAHNNYVAESIQLEIDNVQADIDLLKARNNLLAGADAKNQNLNEQIAKTRQEYDLQIEKEKDLVKQAQLRAEKEKAVLDILKEQIENIKTEQSFWNNRHTAWNNLITSERGDLAESQGKDTYGSRAGVFTQNALMQHDTAATNREEAQKLWDSIHSEEWGFYDEAGNFRVWADKAEAFEGYVADYWNMLADANKAEAQMYEEQYNSWKEFYLNPLKDELEKQKTEQEKQNAEISLANAKGLKTTSNQYASLIANSALQAKKLDEQNVKLKEQQKLYDPQSKKYQEIQEQIDANDKSIIDCQKDQVEWNNAIAQLPFDTLEAALSSLDAINNRMSAFIGMSQTLGQDEGAQVYFEQIANWGEQAARASEQAAQALEYAQLAVANAEGVYGGKTAQEWRDEAEKYRAQEYSNLQSQQEARGKYVDYVLRSYDKLIAGHEHYASVVSGISDLMDEEMFHDKDGKLTDYGVTQIATLVSGYETAQKKMGIYADELAEVNRLYAEGYLTAEQYQERTRDLEKNILDGAKDMKSSMSEVIKMYKDMAKSELEALFKLVDARSEALNKKKSYYDFDKTLRKKNKDIENIQSQIAALEGISGAAAKAKRAQLMSDLSEAQEDLEDTLQEHAIQISQDSLSELKDTMQEAFDEKWDEISRDISAQTEIWADAATLASGSVGTVNETIKRLLNHYGVDTSDLPSYTGFASGTTGVNKNMMAYLHENGREGIVTKNGILMPLLKGEGVLPADATSRLLAMAKGDMSDYIRLPDYSAQDFGENTPEFTINQDNSITIEGSADAVTVEQLKKLHNDWVKDAADYTDKKIHRDFLKGGGRRIL